MSASRYGYPGEGEPRIKSRAGRLAVLLIGIASVMGILTIIFPVVMAYVWGILAIIVALIGGSFFLCFYLPCLVVSTYSWVQDGHWVNPARHLPWN